MGHTLQCQRWPFCGPLACLSASRPGPSLSCHPFFSCFFFCFYLPFFHMPCCNFLRLRQQYMSGRVPAQIDVQGSDLELITIVGFMGCILSVCLPSSTSIRLLLCPSTILLQSATHHDLAYSKPYRCLKWNRRRPAVRSWSNPY